jgi:hypothetical protein
VAVVDDINDDQINDVLIGTLFSSNYCYFLSGVDGETLKSQSFGSPVDALNGIPDIVGDGTMEMVVGGREGEVYCYSGGLGLLLGIEEPETDTRHTTSTHFPNPFSDQITVAFELEYNSLLQVSVYDMSGSKVRQLVNKYQSAGSQTVVWDGKDSSGKEMPTGIYFYEINTNGEKIRQKIVKL